MAGKKPLFLFVPLCLSVSSEVYFSPQRTRGNTERNGREETTLPARTSVPLCFLCGIFFTTESTGNTEGKVGKNLLVPVVPLCHSVSSVVLFFYHREHGETQREMAGKKPLFLFVPLCLSVSSVVYFFKRRARGYTEGEWPGRNYCSR
ncbi:hypothetical protein BY457_104188 [Marinilabilia salmonicolor]|jgi:hypothetical protein|nr:hypothetical protein BY457_104188 [Marinilabilia salmonicolor]